MSVNVQTEKTVSPYRVNIDEYFARIHYTGERTANLETLSAIHFLHPQYIPFENINPLLRIPVKLDLPSLNQKLLVEKRGGYCFEHNLLLKAVLEDLGFKVKGLAARVVWGQSPDAITPRGHMLLLIEIDSLNYIADVGFGGQTLTAPLLLNPGIEQQTPHEPFRLVSVGDEYRLESLIRGEWKALYRFGLMENFQADYEVTSWYLSNHPTSHFVTGLIAARTIPGTRYALRNNELATHHLNGDTERILITEATDLERTIEQTFGITAPRKDVLMASLQKIVSASKQI